MTLDHTRTRGVDDMRKKLLLSSATFIAAITTASAADLPMYTKAPPPTAPVAFNWTGFALCPNLGSNIGAKWANTDDTISVPGASFDFGSNTNSSFIGGGQIGYNWQAPGSSWVFGIEGDIDAQHFSRSLTLGAPVGPFIAGDTFAV